jgi:hypothetical protein
MNVTVTTRDNDDTVEITISTVPFITGNTKKAYWGWMSTNAMLVEPQIVVLQGSGDFTPGANITADFRGGNLTPNYLYFVERDTEPAKTKWYANDFDQGAIGPGGAFTSIGIVAGWRVYRSASPTQFSSTTNFNVS